MWASIKFNRNKHLVLKKLCAVYEDYDDITDMTVDSYADYEEIRKMTDIPVPVIRLLIPALLAEKEVVYRQLDSPYDPTGYSITAKGIDAYHDKKYIRLISDRLKSNIGFWLSIGAAIISVIALMK